MLLVLGRGQGTGMWSPLYRSRTLPTVFKGLAGDENLMRSTFTVAYDSVLPAWLWFLAHTDSKPIILIGDSQGAAILIHLISAQLDDQPMVLRRLLVAILVGGNLQVPAGKTIGATFTNLPLCTSATQTGCRNRRHRARHPRHRPGMGLPRIRVQPHPGQPAPGRRRRRSRMAVKPLIRPAADKPLPSRAV